LPHHNLVQATRQEFLQSIAAKRPVTNKIILIGPDHFSINQQQILSSSEDWNLSTGTFVYEKLFDLPNANLVLKNDHAIYNPLADLKNYFPKASVYPILIGQKVDTNTLDTLVSQIIKICDSNCLLVASVDFSHYLPATLAEVHDAFTINNLHNLDSQNILKAEVDSPQSLYILTRFSQLKKFNLFAHTNSGYLSQNPDTETTTHVFGSYSFGLSSKSKIKTSTITPETFDRSYGVDKFTIDPSSQFVISTINNTTSFLLIKNHQFIHGPEKQQLIKNYFDSIPNDKSLTKDYFWGKLTYERR